MTRPAYRWVALVLTMLVNVPVQTLWITYSPITPEAAHFYGVGEYAVVQLSMLFMAVYVLTSLPASWVVDTRGVRFAVGVGALLVGVGGLLRGLAGASYPMALAATLLVALGQPLVLNAWTSMPAQWFDADKRAGAVGLTTVASLLGMALGMVLPPVLLSSMSVGAMQTLFGAVALAVAVLYVVLYRDGAPAEAGERALVLDGLRHAFSVRPFLVLLAATLLVMGVFNALTSLTSELVAPHGLGASEAGNVGAAMLVGGVIGAAVLPAMSDRTGRRVPFVAGGMAAGAVLLAALALCSTATAFYVVAALLGAAMVPLLPIAMEYAAELVHPTPDGASNGIVQIAGQASVVYIGLLWATRSANGSFTPGLLLSAVLLLVAAAVVARLPESAPTNHP